MLDIDRLHRVIEQYITRGSLVITAPRTVGVTTAIEQLMLAEVWLADVPNRHFVYLADNEEAAAQVQYQFIRLLQSEPGIVIQSNQRGQIRLNVSGMVFFFVGVNYFTQRFVFMGTKVDKIFVDISYTSRDDVDEKLLLMQARGTEIE